MTQSPPSIPLSILLTIVLCCIIHLTTYILTIPLSTLSFNPRLILFSFQIWRCFTSAYAHGGILHLAFNMSTTIYIQGDLERKHGTLPMAHLILLLIPLSSIIYLTTALLLQPISPTSLYQPSVGYSGVLFSFLHLHSVEVRERSLYGYVNVPGWMYPWVLLVAISVVMPDVR